MEEKKRTDEEIEQSKNMYDDIRKCNEILLKENAKLQEQVEKLTEEKWKVQDDLDNYHAENAELKKQVCELKKRLVDEFEAFKVEAYGKIKQQAVKDTAKEIFTELLKGENVCEEVVDDYYGGHYIMSAVTVDKIREIAKERYGVEVE